MSEPWVALLAALVGVVGTVALQFFFGRHRSVGGPSSPVTAASAATDVHAEAVGLVHDVHAEELKKIEAAKASPGPANALAALLNEEK